MRWWIVSLNRNIKWPGSFDTREAAQAFLDSQEWTGMVIQSKGDRESLRISYES